MGGVVDVDALVTEARERAMSGASAVLLPRLDEALDVVDDDEDRAQLLLAKAILLQGEQDPSDSAAAASEAVHLFERVGSPPQAAYAASIAAVFSLQAGNLSEAIDHSVASMVNREQLPGTDPERVRSANALGMLFVQLSAFEPAARLTAEAFEGGRADPAVGVITAYAHCLTIVEAAHGGVELDTEVALDAIAWLDDQPEEEVAARVVGAAMRIELALLGLVSADITDLAHVIDDGIDEVSPRIRAWALLVRACVARRTDDAALALELLDEAIPALSSAGDEQRLSRARRERAEALAALGRSSEAIEEALAYGDAAHAAHLHQVGRLAGQIERRAQLEIARSSLRRRADDLAKEAATDALTGVGSRRWIERTLDGFRRSDGDGSVVLLDLDHFKSINDRFGHQVGDRVLEAVGAILRRCVRDSDQAARYGGEEFVVIAAGAPPDVAVRIAERIRAEIEAAPWHETALGLKVTASAGVAHGPLASLRDAIRLADAALYEAKRAGRNRVLAA